MGHKDEKSRERSGMKKLCDDVELYPLVPPKKLLDTQSQRSDRS